MIGVLIPKCFPHYTFDLSPRPPTGDRAEEPLRAILLFFVALQRSVSRFIKFLE